MFIFKDEIYICISIMQFVHYIVLFLLHSFYISVYHPHFQKMLTVTKKYNLQYFKKWCSMKVIKASTVDFLYCYLKIRKQHPPKRIFLEQLMLSINAIYLNSKLSSVFCDLTFLQKEVYSTIILILFIPFCGQSISDCKNCLHIV